jgi:hypothetical protein
MEVLERIVLKTLIATALFAGPGLLYLLILTIVQAVQRSGESSAGSDDENGASSRDP